MHSRLSRMTPGVISSDLRTLATERCCHLANCSTVKRVETSRTIPETTRHEIVKV